MLIPIAAALGVATLLLVVALIAAILVFIRWFLIDDDEWERSKELGKELGEEYGPLAGSIAIVAVIVLFIWYLIHLSNAPSP